MAQHIVIICGYGSVLTQNIKRYLDHVVGFCNRERPEAIIFPGGFAHKGIAPGRSEPAVMIEYVGPLLNVIPFIYAGDGSYTTIGNIKNIAEFLKQYDLPKNGTAITIFCETNEKRIIELLARRFLGPTTHVKSVSWNPESAFPRIIMNIYTWMAIRIPSLDKLLHHARVWQFSDK